MTAEVLPARQPARRRAILFRAALAVAFLVPVSVLFVQVWQTDTGKIATAQSERKGVTYLTALQSVINAVSRAESVAVAGDKLSFDPLDQAVLAASAVDDQLGGELQAHVVWDSVRTKIVALHGVTLTPVSAYTAFSEVSSLLLVLADKVREESGLIRDPDPDTFFLEDGAAHQLPASVISAGQYGDLVILSSGTPDTQAVAYTGNIIAARAELLSAATNLGNDVQSAVDATASQTLSADLLAKLDAYRVSIDGLAPASSLTAGVTSTQDNAQVMADKAATQAAAEELNGTMLTAIDGLLSARIVGLQQHRWTVVGTGLAALLIACVPLLLLLWQREDRPLRRRVGTGGRRVAAARPPARASDHGPVFGGSGGSGAGGSGAGGSGAGGGGFGGGVVRGGSQLPPRPGVSRPYPEPPARRHERDDDVTGSQELVPMPGGAQHRQWPEQAPGHEGWDRTGVPR